MADPKARIVLSAEDRTKPAFASAMRNMQALNVSAQSIKGGFDGLLAPMRSLGALAVATGAAMAAVSFKNTIDTADELGKLSQRSGIAVENLSALRYAGELADVSLEELGDSLKKLNVNIAAAARGEKAQAEAFAAIGVAVKDASGNVRSADEILGDIADKFQGYADGANKVALANALGGRSFEKLIPLLNGGREGMKASRAELEKFGGVFTQEMAEKAERFNDNITKLGFALEGLKIQALSGFIEKLGQLAEALARFSGDKDVTSGMDVLRRLDGLLPKNPGAAAGTWLADTLGFGEKSVEDLERNVARAQKALEAFDKAGNPADFRRSGLQANLERAQSELNAKRGGEKIGGGGPDRVNPPKGDNATSKKQAPALPNGGNDAEAAARKILDGALKKREDDLAAFRDIEQAHQQFVKALYDDGLVSLDAYYEHQQRSRQAALDQARQAFDAEEALLKKHLATQTKPQEREDTRNKIADVGRRRDAAEREAAQAADRDLQDRTRAAKALEQQVKQLDAQLAALSGDHSLTAKVDIDRQVRTAEETLGKTGGDPAKAQQLRGLLELQQQFSVTRSEFSRVTESAAIAEERLVIASEQGGAGLLETEGRLRDLRSKQLDQLGELITRTEQIAAATKDPAILQSLDEMRLAYERLNATVDPTKLRLDAAAGDIAHTITDGLHEAVLEGKKLSDVLDEIGKRITSIVFDEIVSKPLEAELRAVLKGGAGGGFFGGAGSGVGGLFGIGRSSQGFPQSGGAVPAADETARQAAQESFRGLEQESQKATDSLATMASETTTTSTVLSILPTIGATPATTSLATLNAVGAAPATSALAAFTAAVSAATAALQAMAAGSGGTGGSGVLALFSGGGGGVNLGTASGADLALFYHEGGVVGQEGEARKTGFTDWSKAVRYHTGGIAGLKPDEEQVILQAGEEVVGASDPRHRKNADVADKAEIALGRMASVVQPLPAPVEGLARDEVPAILKRGDEVLTADDPRHINAARGLDGIAGEAGADGKTQSTEKILERIAAPEQAASIKTAMDVVADLSNAILPKGIEAKPQRALEALQADERRAVLRVGEEVITEDDPRHRDNLGWDGAPKYHTGGIVGDAPDALPIASRADAAMRGASRMGDAGDASGAPSITNVYITAGYGVSSQQAMNQGREIQRGMQIEAAKRSRNS